MVRICSPILGVGPKHYAVNAYINKLRNAINFALAISQRRTQQSRTDWRYVRHILFVKGTPFYGFHASYQPYLKILLCDPSLVQSMATILRAGSVLNTSFVVHEVHLGYILQFLSDFGLYGCGWLELGDARLRGHVNTDGLFLFLLVSHPDLRYAHLDIQDFDASKFGVSPFPKTTRSKLEFDAPSHQILNRHLLTARPLASQLRIPGPSSILSSSNHLPTQTPEPLVQSIRELWDDERARRTKRGLDPSPVLPIEDNTPRGAGCDWQSEERDREELEQRLKHESAKWKPKRPETWEALTWTTFESVEMLWDVKWRTLRPESSHDRSSEYILSEQSSSQGDGSSGVSQPNPFEANAYENNDDEVHPHEGHDPFIGSQAFFSTIANESRFTERDEAGPSLNDDLYDDSCSTEHIDVDLQPASDGLSR